MSLGYTSTSFFDFSTTASCGGSPIIIQTVGTGCSSAVANNPNGFVCAAYDSATAKEYTMYSNMCQQEPFNLSTYTRNYVVKSSYSQSDKCSGSPLQGVAIAADSACHANPGGMNMTSYVKANCNGGQPILQECADSSCSRCNTISYTNEPCQLTGAGASIRVECVNSAGKGGGNGGTNGKGGGNATIDQPFTSTATHRNSFKALYCVISAFSIYGLLISI